MGRGDTVLSARAVGGGAVPGGAAAPVRITRSGGGGIWTDRRIDERPEPEDPATIERQAKHAALLKLRVLEEQGVKLSRTFTMEDSHYDMEYEWDAYHHRRDHIESIQFVHEKIALVGLGVSLLNAAGGKFLKRKGGIIEPHVLKSKWEQTLDEHKGTIEALARKYYGPHAGSSAQSPEFRMASALAIGIGSAVAMSLCTGFFMGGGDGDDGGRDDRDRRRRRRDDRRPTLRKHRDAATSDTTGWRDAFGYGGSVPYPQPPSSEQPSAPPDQEPFSRAPPAGGGVAPSRPMRRRPHSRLPGPMATRRRTLWCNNNNSRNRTIRNLTISRRRRRHRRRRRWTPMPVPCLCTAPSRAHHRGLPNTRPTVPAAAEESRRRLPSPSRGRLPATGSKEWRTWARRWGRRGPRPLPPPARQRPHGHTISNRLWPPHRRGAAPWAALPSRARFRCT